MGGADIIIQISPENGGSHGKRGEGISRLVKENCDFTVSMPMVGKITSLNASMRRRCCYEIGKQRDGKR